MKIYCRACEAEHESFATIAGVPVVECANAPENDWYIMIDTSYASTFMGYNGPVWVRYGPR